MKILSRTTSRVLASTLVAGLVAGCSTDPGPAPEEAAAAGYPVTLENCGSDLRFDSPPERVMLLESAAVPILDGIGVFDRVTARAGAFPLDYYDDDLAEAVENVPSLSDDVDASGHVIISQEQILAQTPDLVLGQLEGLSPETLEASGAPVLVQELLCPGTAVDATFETLYDEIGRYGTVFDRHQEAAELVEDLKSRVDAVRTSAADGEKLTAAVLYPSTGGGPLYAYGNGSMAQPQLEAAGLENVFAANDERVFEVQTEQLIAADPQVLILLHQGPDDGVEQAVTSMPGMETVDAVADGRVITQLFNFTEPASPLTITGLEMIRDRLDEDAD